MENNNPINPKYPPDVVNSVFDFLPDVAVRTVACAKRELAERMLRRWEVATTLGKHSYKHLFQIMTACDDETQAEQIYQHSKNTSNLPMNTPLEAGWRFRAAIRFGDLDGFEKWLQHDLRADDIASALFTASSDEIRKRLVEYYDEHFANLPTSSPLWQLAAKCGSLSAFKFLHSNNPLTGFNRLDALQIAVSNGKNNIIEYLLPQLPDTQFRSLHIMNAFFMACRSGNLDVVQLLHRHTNRTTDVYDIAMMNAEHHPHIIAFLKPLQRHANIKKGTVVVLLCASVFSVQAVIFYPSALLWLTSKLGYATPIKLVLKHPFLETRDILSSLRTATEKGQMDVANILLSSGRIGRLKESEIIHLLTEAAESGSLRFSELLLEIQPLSIKKVSSTLTQCAIRGESKTVGALLKDKRLEAKHLESALDAAVGKEDIEMIKLLLKDPRTNAKALADGLQEAILIKDLSSAKQILTHKAIDEKALEKVLTLVALAGKTDGVKLLLQDQRLTGKAFGSALFSAYDQGHPEIVELFLEDVRLHPRYSAFPKQFDSHAYTQAVKLLLEDPYANPEVLGLALYKACAKDYREALQMLLKKDLGAGAFEVALSQACLNETMKAVRLFTKQHQYDADFIAELFADAAYDGYLDIVKHLYTSQTIGQKAMQDALRMAEQEKWPKVIAFLKARQPISN